MYVCDFIAGGNFLFPKCVKLLVYFEGAATCRDLYSRGVLVSPHTYIQHKIMTLVVLNICKWKLP